MKSAEIATDARLHIVCPECGKDDGFRVDHLEAGRTWGPWSCDECGVSIRGVRTVSGADIEIVAAERRLPALLLLKIAGSEPPVFFVLKHDIYWPDDEAESRIRFLIEEHSCPTNFIDVEAIITDGDTDPHGVLRFVQIVPRPADWDADEANDWSVYAALFDRLPMQRIEGSVVIPRARLA